jgi:hypothetical protein
MFDKIFSTIGGMLGNNIGGGIFSRIGRVLGNKIGNYLDDSIKDLDEDYNAKYILDRFILKQEIYGLPIPVLFGQTRVSGKIIWTSKLSEKSKSNNNIKYFNSGVEKSITHNIEYEYFLSFAIAICEGEIKDIIRIWNDGEILDISKYKSRIYKGSNIQKPDPLIERIEGESFCPGFRDLAYMVFEDLPLREFNNNLPNLSFEILRKIDVEEESLVEDLIQSIVVIPGSGEYVYDTEIQYKYLLSENDYILSKTPINSHNYKQIANSLLSLDQLQTTCKNIKWISPVISWFADSLDIKDCSIYPAIEFQELDKIYSEKWQVKNYDRNNARIIGKDEKNNPRYGGTVNDMSILRYLDELKSRNMKIMFYPMIFIDLPEKPWRGRMTGSVHDIADFFNKDLGYNNFILHYAQLVKGKVDAFIIGSEFVNITNIKDQNNNFPAIAELINLAKKVKEILGNEVKISYAADWSEYHHANGGWFNLDELWSSDSIDFIGIDAYFPLTNSTGDETTDEEISRGFQSGIGYDFYYDENKNKQNLDEKFAWKNIKYWWSNKHFNPDGKETSWVPMSKKIWFTEFGFPSIDKSTNQPNVFFDPKSIDGGIPRYSSGETDFILQKRAIKLAINYFKTCDFLENYFLWTWDARPYPSWPHTNIWNDGYLWEKGHWVNSKLGGINLSALLKILCKKAQIDFQKIDVTTINDGIEGIIFEQNIKIIDAINLLRIIYLFDIDYSYSGKIKFVKRGSLSNKDTISTREFVVNNQLISRINNQCKSNNLSELHISYLSSINEYKKEFFSQFIDNNLLNQKIIKAPIVLSVSEIKKISTIILNHTNYEIQEIEFYLPIFYKNFAPTDIIIIKNDSNELRVRILAVTIKDYLVKYYGVVEDKKIYHTKSELNQLEQVNPINNHLIMIHSIQIPFIRKNLIYIAVNQGKEKNIYAEFNKGEKFFIQKLECNSTMGIIYKIVNSKIIYPNLIDNDSEFHIYSLSQIEEISEEDFLDCQNIAMIGNELIAYKSVKKIDKDIYVVSRLIRGLYGTSYSIDQHKEGEYFVALNSLNSVEVSERLLGKTINFFINDNVKTSIFYQNLDSNVLTVKNPLCKINANFLELSFTPPFSSYDNWRNIYQSNFLYKIILESENILYEFETSEIIFKTNISDITLNAESKLSIITIRREDFKESEKLTLDLNLLNN